jgi:hypothetical protein
MITLEKFTFSFFDTLLKTRDFNIHTLAKELEQIFWECDLKKGELYNLALYLTI